MRYQAIYQPIYGHWEVVKFTGRIGHVMYSVKTYTLAQEIIHALRREEVMV
jgi:hypothetical protein